MNSTAGSSISLSTASVYIDTLLQDTYLFVMDIYHQPALVRDEALYRRGVTLVEQVQARLPSMKESAAFIQDVLQAQCALMDYIVLNTAEWDDNIAWLDSPLQSVFLLTLYAGKEMTERTRLLLRDAAPDMRLLMLHQRVYTLGLRHAENREHLRERDQLLKRCAVSAIVLVYDRELRQAMQGDLIGRQLNERYKKLGWRMPLYLWEVQKSDWPQEGRKTQPAGCLLAPRTTPQELVETLRSLPDILTEPGVQQGLVNHAHDFLLRLGWQLRNGMAERFHALAVSLLTGPYAVPLRGVMFSPPLYPQDGTDKQRWLRDAAREFADRQMRQGTAPPRYAAFRHCTGNQKRVILVKL